MTWPFGNLPETVAKLLELDKKLDARYAELTRSFDTLMLALAKLEKEMKLANENISALNKSVLKLEKTMRKAFEEGLPVEEGTLETEE